ncbi:TPA: hypothetical protein ACN8J1_001677 [Staphylococcus aureus]
MKKFIGSVLATTLILGGCSMMENESSKDTNTETKSVPEEMEASKYGYLIRQLKFVNLIIKYKDDLLVFTFSR